LSLKPNRPTPAAYVDALVSGLAKPEEREGRRLMVMQTGYFDDSGSDLGSRWYVLGGFLASVEEWKAVSTKWAQVLAREPALDYFKMSQAMAMDGPFRRGWTVPLRNQRIMELVDIIAELNPQRVYAFLRREDFNTFVKDILAEGAVFNDPYFTLFYHICLSIGAHADALSWNSDCDFVFDEQGKLGDVTAGTWDWMKQNIDAEGAANVSGYLGSPPVFRNDIKFRPLQAADMLAWLVRDCMTVGPDNMEDISRTALKHLEGTKILRLHLDKEMLMKLGASFLIAKARLYGHL
jgi:Protein of unknown function (DUF3800)